MSRQDTRTKITSRMSNTSPIKSTAYEKASTPESNYVDFLKLKKPSCCTTGFIKAKKLVFIFLNEV